MNDALVTDDTVSYTPVITTSEQTDPSETTHGKVENLLINDTTNDYLILIKIVIALFLLGISTVIGTILVQIAKSPSLKPVPKMFLFNLCLADMVMIFGGFVLILMDTLYVSQIPNLPYMVTVCTVLSAAGVLETVIVLFAVHNLVTVQRIKVNLYRSFIKTRHAAVILSGVWCIWYAATFASFFSVNAYAVGGRGDVTFNGYYNMYAFIMMPFTVVINLVILSVVHIVFSVIVNNITKSLENTVYANVKKRWLKIQARTMKSIGLISIAFLIHRVPYMMVIMLYLFCSDHCSITADTPVYIQALSPVRAVLDIGIYILKVPELHTRVSNIIRQFRCNNRVAGIHVHVELAAVDIPLDIFEEAAYDSVDYTKLTVPKVVYNKKRKARKVNGTI